MYLDKVRTPKEGAQKKTWTSSKQTCFPAIVDSIDVQIQKALDWFYSTNIITGYDLLPVLVSTLDGCIQSWL